MKNPNPAITDELSQSRLPELTLVLYGFLCLDAVSLRARRRVDPSRLFLVGCVVVSKAFLVRGQVAICLARFRVVGACLHCLERMVQYSGSSKLGLRARNGYNFRYRSQPTGAMAGCSCVARARP